MLEVQVGAIHHIEGTVSTSSTAAAMHVGRLVFAQLMDHLPLYEFQKCVARLSVYVLVAIVKKRLALEPSLHEILQVLSITLFEQVPILQAFGHIESQEKSPAICNQLNLWDL